MTAGYVLCFILGLFLFLFALFARMQQGNWLAPGAFFALFWAVFILTTLVLFPNNYVHPASILWIIVVVFSVYVGTICGSATMLFRMVPRTKKSYDKKQWFNNSRFNKLTWLRYLAIICSILGFYSSIVIILSTGRSFSDVLYIDAFFQMGRELSVARYSDPNYRLANLAVFLFVFIYAGGLFGGALFAVAKSKIDRLIALLPIVPGISVTLVCTTRAIMLMTLVCFFSSYFSVGMFITQGRLRFFKLKTFLIFLCISPLIVIILVFALISRHAKTSLEISVVLDMLNRLGVAIFGSLASFSYWFPNNWQNDVSPALGRYTFGGPLSLIGLSGRLSHITTEYGNVFTVFRDLISDFTLIGSLLVLLLIGFLGGMAFRKVVRGKIMYLPILMAFYGFTLRSFTGSLFRYSTVLLAWVLFAGYLICLRRRKVSMGKRHLH